MREPRKVFVRTTYAVRPEVVVRALLHACGLPESTYDVLHELKADTLGGDGVFEHSELDDADDVWIEVDLCVEEPAKDAESAS